MSSRYRVLYVEADVAHRFDDAGDDECSHYLIIVSKVI